MSAKFWIESEEEPVFLRRFPPLSKLALRGEDNPQVFTQEKVTS